MIRTFSFQSLNPVPACRRTSKLTARKEALLYYLKYSSKSFQIALGVALATAGWGWSGGTLVAAPIKAAGKPLAINVVAAKKAAAARKTVAKVTAGKPAMPPRHVPTPPDSFLRYKVYDTAQLIAQVQADPKVRQVFARHFSVPESRVVSYMRANLVESYVPKTGRYTVYCVRRNGKIYSVRQTFRKGTKVFSLRNGQPVMKWVCGNPLSKYLPPTTLVKTTPRPNEILTPTDMADVYVPSEVGSGLFETPFLAAPTFAGATPIFFGGGAGLGALSGLLIPLGVIIGSTGGHGGSGTPPSNGQAVVPEPSPALFAVALSMAAAPLLARKKYSVWRTRAAKRKPS